MLKHSQVLMCWYGFSDAYLQIDRYLYWKGCCPNWQLFVYLLYNHRKHERERRVLLLVPEGATILRWPLISLACSIHVFFLGLFCRENGIRFESSSSPKHEPRCHRSECCPAHWHDHIKQPLERPLPWTSYVWSSQVDTWWLVTTGWGDEADPSVETLCFLYVSLMET